MKDRYLPTWDLSTIPEPLLIKAANKRLAKRGGKPKVLRACAWCAVKMGAREMRAHVARCPSRKRV